MTTALTPQKLVKRPRPYQNEACKAVYNALGNGARRVVVAMPTGSGKTFTAVLFVVALIRQMGGNVLWIAHRHELLEQAEAAFREIAPELKITHWIANKKDDSGDVVIASIGSTKTLKKGFTIVIFDEGHHYAEEDQDDDYTNMYAKLLNRIQWAYLIGLTATPERLDKRVLGYDQIAYSITYLDLTRKHRLAKPIYVEMLTKQQVQLQVRGGEFTKKSLGKLNNPERNAKVAAEYVSSCARYGKSLMFVTGVEHCYDMQKAILDLKPDAQIRIIHGTHKKYPFTKTQRDEAIKWFSEGGPDAEKLLINCEVYTEGYDEPSIRTVWLCRPTMSKGLWMQMVGRGARNLEQSFDIAINHIVNREPAGDDGIERFEFSNGAVYYGEDFGEIRQLADGTAIHSMRLQLEKEFYLVQVMDDIGKFHALVSDWELDIRERTEEEVEAERLQTTLQEKKVTLKVLKEQGDIEEEELDLDELGDAVIRDIVGVLIISSYFQKNMGIPCDPERQACLNTLLQFARDCTYVAQETVNVWEETTKSYVPTVQQNPRFDIEKFRNEAYTHCVSAGEFPPSVFKKIVHSFYFRFIKGQLKIKPQGENRLLETWRYIPMVELTPESRQKHIRVATAKVEENKTLNHEFNEKYATRADLDQLWSDIQTATIKHAIPKTKNPTGARRIYNGFVHDLYLTRGKNRTLMLHTDRVIDGPRTGGTFAFMAKLLSTGMQEVLDDPNAIVTITPRKVAWDKQGSAIGANSG